MKRCTTCKAEHDADGWASLRPTVNRNSRDGKVDYGHVALEFRQCHCGSKLAVVTRGTLEEDT